MLTVSGGAHGVFRERAGGGLSSNAPATRSSITLISKGFSSRPRMFEGGFSMDTPCVSPMSCPKAVITSTGTFRRLAMLWQVGADVEAGLQRHHEIQQDEVRRLLLGQADALLSVGGGTDPVALGLEQAHERAGERLVVVNDQDPLWRRCRVSCQASSFSSYWRLSPSTIAASARVVVSPRILPSPMSRSRRRMILPLRVLGRSALKTIRAGRAMAPIFRTTCSFRSASISSGKRLSGLEGYERHEHLSLELVGDAHDGGLGHGRMRDQRALDLHGADAVARHVQHVVNAPEKRQVAVVRALGAVGGEIRARVPFRPIRLTVALRVSPDSAQHRRPGMRDRQEPAAGPDRLLRRRIDRRADPRHRDARAARLHVVNSRKRADHDHARLGLPPGVHDRASAPADVLIVPHPGFRINRLADAAQEPQRGQVVLRRPLRPPLHERADRRRRGVEDADGVLLDDLPRRGRGRASPARPRT